MRSNPEYWDLPIRTHNERFDPNDISFHPKINEGYLEVDIRIFRIVRNWNIRSVSSLISYLQIFPIPIAGWLGWDLRSLRTAHLELIRTLRGRVPSRILTRAHQHGIRSFGARSKVL